MSAKTATRPMVDVKPLQHNPPAKRDYQSRITPFHSKPELAAIMHADVVGSTRLIKQDHPLALSLMQSAFERLAATVKQRGGLVCEIRGDAVVARFSRPSDAVFAACSFQATEREEFDSQTASPTQTKRMQAQLRIGISLGEVIQTDTALSGAGVVMAQRLEQLAKPTGVVVQGSIAEMLIEDSSLVFSNMGEHPLKGFDQPIMVYTAQLPGNSPETLQTASTGNTVTRSSLKHSKPELLRIPRIKLVVGLTVALLAIAGSLAVLSLYRNTDAQHEEPTVISLTENKPSIAVLPLTQLADQTDNAYITDGIIEDVITDLSKLSGLLVISQDSSFSFHNSTMEIAEIANTLGARYILDGNSRHSGNRIRINTRLIDTATDTNIWAERYDFETENIFDSQDKISGDIIEALALRITPEEKRILDVKPTESLLAYEYFRKGQRLLHTSDMVSGREYFHKAIELDPTFTRSYAALSISHAASTTQTLSKDRESDISQAFKFATKAVAIDNNSPEANLALSLSFLFRAQHEDSLQALNKTLQLNPNSSDAYMLVGWNHVLLQNYDSAVANLSNAFRLRPTGSALIYTYLGIAYCLTGRLDEAETLLDQALESNSELVAPRIFRAVTYHRLGRVDDAVWDMEELLLLYPEFTISDWQWNDLFADSENSDFVAILDTLQELGFPE